MALFEGYERRIDQITPVLQQYGMKAPEDAEAVCKEKGLDVAGIVKDIQPICFENACWAYTLGAAIAIKKGQTRAAEIAETLGEGLQAFCIPGSVADDRKVGIGHGNLASMLLKEETRCFAFLAGHESFAAAEGAIGLAKSANKARQEPLRVILNGLGKDAALIISRVNGFTYVQTEFDYSAGELSVVNETAYSDGERAKVPASRRGHLQEGVRRPGQEVLLGCIRRRYGADVASRQHGRRAGVIRHDGYSGPDALRRAVRRLVFRAGARGDDGIDRNGQQSDGRRVRRRCRRRREGAGLIGSRTPRGGIRGILTHSDASQRSGAFGAD